MNNPDVKVLCCVKRDGQKYIVKYEVGSEAEALAAITDMAGNPDLGFDWFDAGIMARGIGHFLAVESSKTTASNFGPMFPEG